MGQENSIQKKSNPKILVVALAVICILLAASVVGVVTFYQPNGSSSQLAEKDQTISNLQAQIAQRQLNQTSGSGNTAYYVSQIAALSQQVQNLNDALNGTSLDLLNFQTLTISGTLYSDSFSQDANSSTTIFNDQLEYAGYIAVQTTASANTTYVEVIYNFQNAIFDENRTLGLSGSTLFPVLPGVVQIKIGNTNSNSSNSGTAIAVYYY